MTREEAIEVVKERLDYYETEKRLKKACEILIPELAESDDERIRKALIDSLKTSKSVGELKFILPEPTREECLAYLEKQKPIPQEERNVLEDIIVFVSGYADKRVVTKWVSFLKSLRPQPKQKWSDEDKEMAEAVCSYLNHYKSYTRGVTAVNIEEYKGRLKTIFGIE